MNMHSHAKRRTQFLFPGTWANMHVIDARQLVAAQSDGKLLSTVELQLCDRHYNSLPMSGGDRKTCLWYNMIPYPGRQLVTSSR
ncbi:hypothetical protein VTK73DRAFT_8482 [Phialemonium thermophilum]|uniref:Uncharacterized protein n=1 Tax=Phialemonium thermophilum TaxID=223376 RepID=A0ABR3W8H3_9PEZI